MMTEIFNVNESLQYSDNEERILLLSQIEAAEAQLLTTPQEECPLDHQFAPGIYVRTILMKKGLYVIGHEHKTRHFNIVSQGRAKVMMEGVVSIVEAPAIFISEPGVRKMLLIEEDMVWSTVHATDETDLAKLEENLIVKSGAYTRHHQTLKDQNGLPESNS